MSLNLLESVKSFINPDLISKASSYLGESNENISKAVGISIPTILAAFINRAESGDAATLLNSAKAATNNNVLGNLGALFSGSSSSVPAFTSGLLANNTGNVANALSNFSGIKRSSAGSLLNMIEALVLAVIGKRAIDTNLDPGSLLSFLGNQKTAALGALPTGFNVHEWLGAAQKAVSSAANELHAVVPKKTNWLWPLIIIVLIILAIIYFMRSCNKQPETVSTADTANAMPPVMDTTATAPARESMMVKLADGTEINAYKGGIEDMLVQCLDDANCKGGKDKWFDFDNINFEMSSATVTAESKTQVNNIVAILKAYPKAKIKIGGYTDKTGDDAANKKLSQDRANAVLNALKTAGANASQLLGAEGYGSEFAKVAASASDEERKTDRRISVQLREK